MLVLKQVPLENHPIYLCLKTQETQLFKRFLKKILQIKNHINIVKKPNHKK